MPIINVSNNQTNTIFFNTNDNNSANTDEKKTNKNTLYAGNLNIGQDIIGQKKAMANKKALKTIIDQFNKDQKIDNRLSDRYMHIDELKIDASEALKEIDKINAARKELKASYDMSDNSSEQQDLDLIERALKDGYSTLTSEEKEHLSNNFNISEQQDIDILSKALRKETKDFQKSDYEKLDSMTKTFTEYQGAALDLYGQNDYWTRKLNYAKDYMDFEYSAISATKIELLKSSPMVDAQKKADDILEEASKEIIGLLVNEAVEHIEETQEEEKEKAEEAAKEAEEAKKEEDNSNANTDDVNQMLQTVNDYEQLQSKLKREISVNQILEEDFKGLEIDEEL